MSTIEAWTATYETAWRALHVTPLPPFLDLDSLSIASIEAGLVWAKVAHTMAYIDRDGQGMDAWATVLRTLRSARRSLR